MASMEAEEYLREAVKLNTLAQMYDISPHTLREHVRTGKIPSECVVKVGRMIRIKLKPFQTWLERRSADAKIQKQKPT